MSKYDKDIIRMARENKTRKEIAEALGVSDVYVSWLCHKIRKNGTRVELPTNRNNRRVRIKGKEYESMTKASYAIGRCGMYIANRLRHGKPVIDGQGKEIRVTILN